MGRWPKRDAAARGSTEHPRAALARRPRRGAAGRGREAAGTAREAPARREPCRLHRALIDELWGDEPPATARQSLHVHVGRLRRLLGDADGPSPLETTGGGYLLRLGADELDALRFGSLVESARAEQARARSARRRTSIARRSRSGAATRWGIALPGRRRSARGSTSSVRGDRGSSTSTSSSADPPSSCRSSSSSCEGAAPRAPARPAHARAVRSRSSGGRPRRLSGGAAGLDEVGLQPGPRLRELEQAILRQDPALTTAPLGGAALRSNAVAGDSPASPSRLRRARARDREHRPPRRAAARGAGAEIVVGPDSLVEIDPATNRVVSSTPVGEDHRQHRVHGDAIWVANTPTAPSRGSTGRRGTSRIVGGAAVAHQLASGLSGDVWLSSFEEPVVTLIARAAGSSRAPSSRPRRRFRSSCPARPRG